MQREVQERFWGSGRGRGFSLDLGRDGTGRSFGGCSRPTRPLACPPRARDKDDSSCDPTPLSLARWFLVGTGCAIKRQRGQAKTQQEEEMGSEACRTRRRKSPRQVDSWQQHFQASQKTWTQCAMQARLGRRPSAGAHHITVDGSAGKGLRVSWLDGSSSSSSSLLLKRALGLPPPVPPTVPCPSSWSRNGLFELAGHAAAM